MLIACSYGLTVVRRRDLQPILFHDLTLCRAKYAVQHKFVGKLHPGESLFGGVDTVGVPTQSASRRRAAKAEGLAPGRSAFAVRVGMFALLGTRNPARR